MRELSEQEIVRREKLQNIENPYPERCEINYELHEASLLEDGTTGVKVAGRIILMRKMGKMSILTIGDIKGKIQISNSTSSLRLHVSTLEASPRKVLNIISH